MSVLRDIIMALEGLLEGSVGVDRVVPAGKVSVVGSDHVFAMAESTEDPRPCYVGTGDDYTDESMPSDVSGDYLYRARRISIYVAYGYGPEDDPTERDLVMADDEKVLVACLSYPLNWALVPDWCGTEISSGRISARDEDGVIAISYIQLILGVSYREDLS